MTRFNAMLIALVSAFCPLSVSGQLGMMGPGHMKHMSMVRHHYVMTNGISSEYASKKNPLQLTTANIEAGKKLYGQNCAQCHGPTGLGDGQAGKALNPRPANVAAASKMPMASDSYLYWTIAEGGTPIGTAMPPFRDTLKAEDIWKIITYLRTL